LPRKAFATIGKKRLLDHVIDTVVKSVRYLNKNSGKNRKIVVTSALLVPFEDEIVKRFQVGVPIVEGPELDVLSRFRIAVNKFKPDYLVRVTGDCPMLPSYVISKHITLALMREYDYVSNVDEACRLSLDGIDCEVISSRMFEWLDQHSLTDAEREHVTIKARTAPPEWAKRGFTAGHFDQHQVKYSVDTPQDLDRVRFEYQRVTKKVEDAERIYGRDNIHRF